MDKARLYEQLKLHEGKKNKPYKDTVGKLTIGIGRNLDDRGITEEEIVFLFGTDVALVEKELDKNLKWWRDMSEVRQRVLVDMCFNLGITKLLTFKNTLEAMRTKRYEDAASGMLNSLWAKQVKGRAVRLANMMRTGEDYDS
jgi:lysozyme